MCKVAMTQRAGRKQAEKAQIADEQGKQTAHLHDVGPRMEHGQANDRSLSPQLLLPDFLLPDEALAGARLGWQTIDACPCFILQSCVSEQLEL